ncbi:PREDICTED: centromere protein C, partial [Merops nubicus]|uniref:centromere protein C n=1 Tax=Merops nubicus TaxID=57421 RepID=UPI0004F00534
MDRESTRLACMRNRRKKIDVQPGQNILKLVEDCFESCGSDLTISSPCGSHCSTPVVGSNLALLGSERRETNNILKAVETLCQSPAMPLDSEDDNGAVGSSLLVKEASSPGPVYSSSISPPSPPLVTDQEIEIENECEFLIDDSYDASCNSWISIPHKKKKSKKNLPSITVSKCQPSKKTENKKGKNRQVQVKALTKQKTDDSDAREFKGATESDPVSSSTGRARKSRKENSTHKGKTEKSALRQGSPNKKEMSSKPEGEELMSPAGLEVNAPDTEQCKTRVMPSEDSPLPSAGHQKQQTVSSKENLRSPKDPQSASKTSQPLVPKKQTAKQKVPKGKVAKRLTGSVRKKLKKSVKKSSNKKSQLQRQESSDSEPGEEEPEQEPVKLDEVFTSPLQQKLQTPGSPKLAKSEKPKNVLHSLESLSAGNDALVQALQYLVDSIKNSGKKQMSPKSSGKTPKKTHHRMSEGACSSREDTDSQTPSDSSSEQDMARKKQKDSFAVVDAAGHESGPVLEHGVKMVSGLKSPEQDSVSTDNSEDLNSHLRALLSDEIARHKIVLPSNTPNVRRTKRIRLRPLEYWRGERINYTMSPSGGLVINGIVCPETEPDRKIKQRKCDHNQKRDEK